VGHDRAFGRAATVVSARGWQPVRGLRREEAARYVGVSPTMRKPFAKSSVRAGVRQLNSASNLRSRRNP
jgi:hypothetical protein